MRQQTILDSLARIANGKIVKQVKYNFAEINGVLIHLRFKSSDKNKSCRYPFNINHATLTAKYELWVCDTNGYYLVPIDIIKSMYNDPDAYSNKTEGQENIRTLTVHTDTNVVDYGRNGKKRQIAEFKNRTM